MYREQDTLYDKIRKIILFKEKFWRDIIGGLLLIYT